MGDPERALGLARIDQMWADLRQHRVDIETIALCGMPLPDDEGAAEYQDRLVRMLACVVAAELGARQLE
jgi:hypothetical protein